MLVNTVCYTTKDGSTPLKTSFEDFQLHNTVLIECCLQARVLVRLRCVFLIPPIQTQGSKLTKLSLHCFSGLGIIIIWDTFYWSGRKPDEKNTSFNSEMKNVIIYLGFSYFIPPLTSDFRIFFIGLCHFMKIIEKGIKFVWSNDLFQMTYNSIYFFAIAQSSLMVFFSDSRLCQNLALLHCCFFQRQQSLLLL